MGPEDVLTRIAATLRQDVGPMVAEPFAKTQAFMAAVILEKLARQLRSHEARVEANRADLAAMVDDLRAGLGSSAIPAGVDRALTDVVAAGNGGLGRLVTALYTARPDLGEGRFDEVMARVRQTLRARLDRQLEYAS